jgi:hypothetical protein
MKFKTGPLLASLSVTGASAFIVHPHSTLHESIRVTPTTTFSASPTSLSASHSSESSQTSRRELLATATAAFTVIALSSASSPARADIDYSKVQDLLGVSSGDTSASQTYNPKGSRPTWLTEPTEEFKANEAKASEFKRAQIERKKIFAAFLEKLETDPNDGDLLAKDLDEMRRLVRAEGGLPLGITKDEVIKRVRRRKAKRFWPTPVEIA